MKKVISFMIAVSLGLGCTCLARDYSALAAQGYRWVTVNGPYACTTAQNAQRIVNHDTDEAELHVVQSIRCYYLIPGTIVQVIKEDPETGMSKVSLPDITRSLWTCTRFLSKHPVRDTYGVIETPQDGGMIPTADTIFPELFPNRSTAPTGRSVNP
jgi:hypothetical protein